MAKSIRRIFWHNWSPGSQRRDYVGHAVSEDSPFTVFKDQDGKWMVGHDRSGLSVNRLIPPKLMRSRMRLLLWLEDMARDKPLEVAMLGMVESSEMLSSEDFREYGDALRNWSAAYKCI